MHCPHCKSELGTIEIFTSDGQPASVQECQTCGGHLLVPGLVHLLSLSTSQNLDSVIPQANSVPVHPPVCTQCQQTMVEIKDDMTPQTVTVFLCPNRHFEFYPNGQLHLLKRAQHVKIDFANLWGIPLTKIAQIAVPLAIVFSLVTVGPQTLQLLNRSQEVRISADEPISTPRVNQLSDTSVSISFVSREIERYSIHIISPIDKTLTDKSKTTKHAYVIKDLEPNTTYTYMLLPSYQDEETYGPYNFKISVN